MNGALNQYPADALYMEMITQLPFGQSSNMNGWCIALSMCGVFVVQ